VTQVNTNIAVVTVFIVCVSANAQQPHVDLGGKEASIPITLRNLRAVVPVTVNGKGPYDFYFDPGSQGLGVEQSLVETLALPPVAKAGVKSGGKGVTASAIVAVEKMELGDAVITGGQAIAFPRGTFGGAGQPVGMLSPTLFPGYLVTLDYPAKMLKLQAGKLPTPDFKEVFSYLDRGSLPALRIDAAGVAIETQIDTNSNGGLTLPRSYAKRVPLMAPPVEAGKVRSDRGEFTYADAKIKGIVKIGKFTIENPDVRFTDVVKRGNIGLDWLKDYSLTIDIRQRRFRLQSPSP
jgi:hypothetical protein